MLRWKREGARHTAMFMGVIWFSSTEEVTSLRKQRSVCNTSLFSSDISMMAACTACNLWSFGTSAHLRWLIYWLSTLRQWQEASNHQLLKCGPNLQQSQVKWVLYTYTDRYEGRSRPACWWAEVQVDPWRTASPCLRHHRQTDPHSLHCQENSHSSV